MTLNFTPCNPRSPAWLSLALACALPAAAAGADPTHKLSPALQRAQSGSAPVEVLILLRDSSLPTAPAAAGQFPQRTVEVAALLQQQAETAQADLQAWLLRRGIASERLWISNALHARLPPAVLTEVAAREDVRRIESDALIPAAAPVEYAASAPAKAGFEPHLLAMQVPQAWALGARGQGVVVAGQDTGYDWQHPALRAAYRGWDGNQARHDGHWYDAVRTPVWPGLNRCGYASAAPCDDDAHGTHTLGTAVGDGGPLLQIGVAPDARWIGCRNMDRGLGRPSTYLGCLQFFLAPTDVLGAQPDARRAPHVIINSWGCPLGPPPAGEDCAWESFDRALANLRAAGLLTVVAAGNGDSGCASIDAPPSHSADALVVGATDNAGVIAPFSLWGPITFDGSLRIKPDLVAPGVGIPSSIPGGGYASFSGTSMATPAVVGVAALMMSANPLLIGQPDALQALLQASARPALSSFNCLGQSGQLTPNPIYGHGRVDAEAAVRAATAQAVSAGHAGSWFDPQRDGEGWILQVLEDGRAALLWFTYPPGGSAASQDWLIASEGRIRGDLIEFDRVEQVSGGRFGAGFDAAAIRTTPWGSLRLRFDDCGSAQLDYSGPPAYGSGQRRVQRLTALAGGRCGQVFAPSGDPQALRSAAWFDPQRAGEGWVVEALDGDRAAIYWFGFDPAGQPLWLYGLGSATASGLRFDDLRRRSGGRFGDGFDAAALVDRPWGSLQIEFTGCDTAELSYRATEPGYGEGRHSLRRLTRLRGLDCAPAALSVARD